MKKRFLASAVAALILGSCSNGISPVTNDWDDIIENYKDDGSSIDYAKLTRLNLALAETGQLAEKAFSYTQAGSAGILPEWDKTEGTGELLSDIYFSMGHVALSQRMAFEASVLYDGECNTEMMLRLIQTNLIFGEYPVAEKYISALSRDRKFKAVAGAYSKFIGDDKAVEDDPVLGPLRKCIPEEDFISGARSLDLDLKDIIRTNPAYHKTIEYLGMMYLLDCETENFRALLDEFYGTEALPELPEAFAEAACMMSELQPGYWKTVGVSSDVFRSYNDFLNRMGAGLSLDKYKDTYWYYMMRVHTGQIEQTEQ